MASFCFLKSSDKRHELICDEKFQLCLGLDGLAQDILRIKRARVRVSFELVDDALHFFSGVDASQLYKKETTYT